MYFDTIGFNLLTYPSASVNPETLIPRQATPYLDEKRFPRVAKVTDAELEGLRKLKKEPAQPKKVPGIPDAKVAELNDLIKELGINAYRCTLRRLKDQRSTAATAPTDFTWWSNPGAAGTRLPEGAPRPFARFPPVD